MCGCGKNSNKRSSNTLASAPTTTTKSNQIVTYTGSDYATDLKSAGVTTAYNFKSGQARVYNYDAVKLVSYRKDGVQVFWDAESLAKKESEATTDTKEETVTKEATNETAVKTSTIITEEAQAEAVSETEAETAKAIQTETAANLDGMTVADLKAYAKENDIDISGVTLKADILETIKKAQ